MYLSHSISSDLIQGLIISPIVLIASLLKFLVWTEQIHVFICSLPNFYDLSLHYLLFFSKKMVIYEQGQVLRLIHVEMKILAQVTRILKK